VYKIKKIADIGLTFWKTDSVYLCVFINIIKEIYIQDKFVETISAANTGEVLQIISKKIRDKEIAYNNNQPINLRIEPTQP
jgi:hypothetical protein